MHGTLAEATWTSPPNRILDLRYSVRCRLRVRELARDPRVWAHVSREECVLGSSPRPVASITWGTSPPSSSLHLAKLDSKARQRRPPERGARVPPGAEPDSRGPRTGRRAS